MAAVEHKHKRISSIPVSRHIGFAVYEIFRFLSIVTYFPHSELFIESSGAKFAFHDISQRQFKFDHRAELFTKLYYLCKKKKNYCNDK